MLGCRKNKIELVNHDETWSSLFEKEKQDLVTKLDGLIESIEHIGSTAIANIVAKPIIDIAIMVKSFEQMDRIITCFNEINYEYKGDLGIAKRMYFVKSDGVLSLFHVHVYEHGNSDFINNVLFRDYVNSNEKIKQSYNKLKFQLKEKYQDDRPKYTEGKAEFIKKQIKKANVKYQEYMHEYNQPFKGWDFSYIKKRMQSEEIEWNYKEIIEPYISKCHCLLDMGTGGGEFLSDLKNLPSNTFATEGYPPNIEVARKKLSALHITVMEVKDDGILNFRNHFFDLIINRHESYNVDEIHRVLTNIGVFVTQQVGGNDCHEINEFLEVSTNRLFHYWDLPYAVDQLTLNFKVVETKSQQAITTFYDIGALLYYLKAVEWQIPDFTVLKYFEKLLKLEQFIKTNKKFEATAERFLLIARKKG